MKNRIYVLNIVGISAVLMMMLCFIDCNNKADVKSKSKALTLQVQKVNDSIPKAGSANDSIRLDTVLYNSKLLSLVHNKPSAKWPVKAPYPLPSAILPFSRIVAYYGNFYSKNMGILGALPAGEMLLHLKNEVSNWQKADSLTPVIPALHYIAVTAQALPGKNNKYRLRMPFSEIDKALELAKKINAIVFLDIQAGWSSFQEEVPPLEKYLILPNVHLGIDPEYSMKGIEKPCAAVGSFDAADINYASAYLANLVQEYHLPPKILVVHRFQKGMVTNYKNIKTHPEVQIVMHMDGFGFPAKKIDSYKAAIANEPVQFTGFKVFYKNDTLSPGHKTIMQPSEILKLYPVPVYIQYQ